MQYNEITLKVLTGDVDTAAAIANMVVPYGLYIEDYSDLEEVAPQIAHVDLFSQELLGKDRTHALLHIYIPVEENPAEAISFLKERFTVSGIICELSQNAVDEEDWATAWKKYYFPTKVGEKLVVVPSWEKYNKKENEVILTLDPGMAFGTGTHDTTRLCMRLLEHCVSPGVRLLDIGTGSGILAVSALLLGADYAIGVDIDEVAVRVAKENAAINNVTECSEFVAGDLTDKVNGKFNVITANIVADVIIRLAPSLEQFMTSDGVFIASGIIASRADEVVEALEAQGLFVTERLESGGWVALLTRKK